MAGVISMKVGPSALRAVLMALDNSFCEAGFSA
jgi:hypothetical protein